MLTVLMIVLVLTSGANFFINLAALIYALRKNGSSGAKDPSWWLIEFGKLLRPIKQSLDEVRKRLNMGPFRPTTEDE